MSMAVDASVSVTEQEVIYCIRLQAYSSYQIPRLFMRRYLSMHAIAL
jgi:hypothetical protein